MKKYKTIVVDPPWNIKFGKDMNRVKRPSYAKNVSKAKSRENWNNNFDYKTMSLSDIGDLPINQLSDGDSHLYLWVINKYVAEAYEIARRWGFTPVTLLVWAKNPMGLGLGGTFVQTTEYILFCRKGKNIATRREHTSWWNWKRPAGGILHSKKPEEFQTLVQSISPGPYLELFARRKREGWDVWGDEVESDIDLYFNQTEGRVLGTAA